MKGVITLVGGLFDSRTRVKVQRSGRNDILVGNDRRHVLCSHEALRINCARSFFKVRNGVTTQAVKIELTKAQHTLIAWRIALKGVVDDGLQVLCSLLNGRKDNPLSGLSVGLWVARLHVLTEHGRALASTNYNGADFTR